MSSRWKTALSKRMVAPAIALATIMSLGAHEFFKPDVAQAAVGTPAPAAAALDDNSVSALLSLDKAMETLAARVTPAIVNVTVTSRAKADPRGDEQSENMQQFFGPFGPFGRPKPQIEHGLGSGVIISPNGYIVTNNH